MPTTLQDIADQLNLSRPTVSRSLRHDPAISPDTRARVLQEAIRLNYQFPRAKTTKETQKANTPRKMTKIAVGVFFTAESLNHVRSAVVNNQYLAGLMSAAGPLGVRLELHALAESDRGLIQQDKKEAHPITDLLQEKQCKAVIFQGPHEPSDVRYVAERLPTVWLGHQLNDQPVDVVLQDNIGGMQKLVSHLAELGHRRLIWCSSSRSVDIYDARLMGFEYACKQHGIQYTLIKDIDPDKDAGQITDSQCRQLIHHMTQGYTGIVAVNDSIALPILNSLEAHGIDVPGQMSLVGFDALGQASHQQKQLTSIDPCFRDMSRLALYMLRDRLNDVSLAYRHTFPVSSLKIADTTGTAPNVNT